MLCFIGLKISVILRQVLWIDVDKKIWWKLYVMTVLKSVSNGDKNGTLLIKITSSILMLKQTN